MNEGGRGGADSAQHRDLPKPTNEVIEHNGLRGGVEAANESFGGAATLAFWLKRLERGYGGERGARRGACAGQLGGGARARLEEADEEALAPER